MRTLFTLCLVSMIGSIALPAAGQALYLLPASAPKAEPIKHAANGAVRQRGAAKRWKRGYVIRHRAEDLCSIVNGWRAFPLRGSYGYFNTDPKPCCRC
jgi:hypothetical protein